MLKKLAMNSILVKMSLSILQLKNFSWMKRELFVWIKNSVRLLIFYITEATTISTIGFSYL